MSGVDHAVSMVSELEVRPSDVETRGLVERVSDGYTEGMPLYITLERKVVRVGDSLRVTIPREIQTILRLKVGDTLVFAASNGDIVIRKK